MVDGIKKILGLLVTLPAFLFALGGALVAFVVHSFAAFIQSSIDFLVDDAWQYIEQLFLDNSDSYVVVESVKFRDALGDLVDAMKVVAYYFDVKDMVVIVTGAYSVKLIIRFIRWLLSCIPTLNAG